MNIPYAAVDFDNTCIHNDIGSAVFNYMCRFFLIKNKNKEEHRNIFLHYHKLHDKGEILKAYMLCTQVLTGYTKKELEKLVKDVVQYEEEMLTTDKLYGKIIPKGLKINTRTSSFIENLIRKKIKIYIVSASSEIIVQSLLKLWFSYWNAGCIGIKNKIIDGILTENLIEPISGYEGKIDCIKKYIDPNIKPVIAIGDSKNDLPMLEYAETKVIVGDKLVPYIKNIKNEKNKNWYQL